MEPNSAGRSKAEITLRVIVLGLILSVVMGAANVYVGLKAGMTVSASIPAAVMAMLLFRLFFKNSTILEANQVQTCASAGESLAAGIIFTMPAMILIGYWDSFDFWTVTIIAFTGGLLGILFMIPMRKVFVINNDELKYPEAVACAAVLQAGEGDDDAGAGTNLILGGLLGGVVKLTGSFFSLISGSLETARIVDSRILYFGGDLSPMLIAVGFHRSAECSDPDFYRRCLGLADWNPAYGWGGCREMLSNKPKKSGAVRFATSGSERW